MASPRQIGPGSNCPASARALVEAAGELLVDRAPSEITGRDIAGRAGVPYGLVHRHFGSKTGVIVQALAASLARFRSDALDDDGLPIPLEMGRRPQIWRTLSHLSLDRGAFDQYQAVMPTLARVRDGIGRLRPDLDDDQRRALAGLALAMEVARPLHRVPMSRAVGLEPDDPAIDEFMARWIDGMYRGRGPLGVAPTGGLGASSSVETVRQQVSDDAAADVRLVAAGAQLLEEHAPSAISGRAIAHLAGVNYGLVHHYFGTKDEVLRRAAQLHRDQFFADRAGAAYSPRFFAAADHPGYVRALSWITLDSTLVESGQRYPVVDQILGRLIARTPDAATATATRVAVFAGVGAQMTWALLLPILEVAIGPDARRLESMLAAPLRTLMTDPLGGAIMAQ